MLSQYDGEDDEVETAVIAATEALQAIVALPEVLSKTLAELARVLLAARR